jgi:hypothetical protein
LVFEDSNKLFLFAGAPPDWFTRKEGMRIENLPTHFGKCSVVYTPTENGATLELVGNATPPDGFVLRLPPIRDAKVTVDGKKMPAVRGDFALPAGTRKARIDWPKR